MYIVNNTGKLSLRVRLLLTVALVLSAVLSYSGRAPTATLKVPPGFTISVYADKVKDAREMALGARGTLFVGSQSGNVHAVIDRDHDNKAETVFTIARGLHTPNGVAFRDGALYVAEVNRILRFDQIE